MNNELKTELLEALRIGDLHIEINLLMSEIDEDQKRICVLQGRLNKIREAIAKLENELVDEIKYLENEMKSTPVFPCDIATGKVFYNAETHENELVTQPHSGITLRQYYAAKLIAPMVFSSNNGTSLEQDVTKVFEIADAMIKFEEQGK